MQSFQKLATLIAMMLFASKGSAALPKYSPDGNSGIGSVGNQIGVASGNISPSSVNGGNPGYYPSYYPGYYPGGNSAASTIGTAGNQIGVASGNINPSSVKGDLVDLKIRLDASTAAARDDSANAGR